MGNAIKGPCLKLENFSPRKIPLFLGGILFVVFCVIYFPLLRYDPVLLRDDVFLVKPIESLSTISEYIGAVQSDLIKDVQPLRDLSFLLDVKLRDWFGFRTYHFTNLIILTGCSVLIFQLLMLLRFSLGEALIGTLLVAMHPILVSGFGWISSRKHLLGFFLVLYSLKSLMEGKKLNSKVVGSYILAMCSHQIFLFYPLWVFLWMKLKKWEFSRSLALVMVLGGLFMFGLGYYKTFYIGTGDDSYHLYSLSEHISRSVLSAGRATALIFTPFSIAAAYYQGSIYNLLGIAIFILFLFAIYKSPARSDAFPWALLAALIFTPSFIAFVNDTYLFLPLTAVMVAGLFLLRPLKKGAQLSLIIVALLFGAKSFQASKMWQSDLALWQYSYEQENAPYNALQLANELEKRNPDLALEFYVIGGRDFDLVSHHPLMTKFVKAIYNSKLPLARKLEIFETSFADHDIYKGFYGLTLLQGSPEQAAKGVSFLHPIANSEFRNKPGTLGFQIIELLKNFCRNNPTRKQACIDLKLEL